MIIISSRAVMEVWKNSLKESYNVDANMNMNELAAKILEMAKSKFSSQDGIYFRQFLPVSTDVSTCIFCLFLIVSSGLNVTRNVYFLA